MRLERYFQAGEVREIDSLTHGRWLPNQSTEKETNRNTYAIRNRWSNVPGDIGSMGDSSGTNLLKKKQIEILTQYCGGDTCQVTSALSRHVCNRTLGFSEVYLVDSSR